jgi:hypothetical protein
MRFPLTRLDALDYVTVLNGVQKYVTCFTPKRILEY